jgi:hypothetical protein
VEDGSSWRSLATGMAGRRNRDTAFLQSRATDPIPLRPALKLHPSSRRLWLPLDEIGPPQHVHVLSRSRQIAAHKRGVLMFKETRITCRTLCEIDLLIFLVSRGRETKKISARWKRHSRRAASISSRCRRTTRRTFECSETSCAIACPRSLRPKGIDFTHVPKCALERHYQRPLPPLQIDRSPGTA